MMKTMVMSPAAAALAACLLALAPARAVSIDQHPVAVAVRHGDCASAVKLLNPNVARNDRDTSFLAGRMLSEGICVEVNLPAAGHYFAHAAELGDRAANLDYAAAVGLGEGFQQSYERAGSICREGGVDAGKRLSDYALGYACTLRGLAGKILRQSLPNGAFQPDTGDLRVDIAPGGARLAIRATPLVARARPAIGSRIGTAMIDAEQEINKAWRTAVAMAPKPDAARLDSTVAAFTLDVDARLEAGLEAKNQTRADQGFEPLMRSDLHASTAGIGR